MTARACEELLLSSGLADEAYERYAYRALREEMTYAGTKLRVLDVAMAYRSGLQAAQRLDRAGDFVARVKTIVAGGSPFVLDALPHDLGLPSAPRVVAARRTKPPRR